MPGVEEDSPSRLGQKKRINTTIGVMEINEEQTRYFRIKSHLQSSTLWMEHEKKNATKRERTQKKKVMKGMIRLESQTDR